MLSCSFSFELTMPGRRVRSSDSDATSAAALKKMKQDREGGSISVGERYLRFVLNPVSRYAHRFAKA